MPKKTLRPANLSFQPRPSYPYSPGATAEGWVFTAGQVAWNSRAGVFPAEPPARTTVQALLADAEMLVEIEAIAFIGK